MKALPRFALALVALATSLFQGIAEGAESTADKRIELAAGDAITLSFDADIGTALVADPEAADVEVLDLRNVFVIGRSPNITSLKVFGVNSELLGAYVVRVHSQSTYAQTVVKRIAGENSRIRVEAVGDALFVSGEAENASEAERVLRGIRAVVGDRQVVDALSLGTPAQVNLEVIISEVSRNVTQELGINWGMDINPFVDPLRTLVTGLRLATGPLRVAPTYEQTLQFLAVNPDGSTSPRSSLDTNEIGVTLPTLGGDGRLVLAHYEPFNSSEYRVTTFVEALALNGLAIIHARPNLTVVSGESAAFNSGLEIPIPTATELGLVGTEYLQTGVDLTFTPVVLSSTQISLTVEPRIREVTTGGARIGGADVPNLNRRSVATTVELGDGESLPIAGLYRRSTTSNSTGIPLLKDIPVWGALFRSTRETQRSVELIVIVTPNIVTPIRSSLASTASSRNPSESAQRLGNEFFF